jgi:excisionase family DNA binding protein
MRMYLSGVACFFMRPSRIFGRRKMRFGFVACGSHGLTAATSLARSEWRREVAHGSLCSVRATQQRSSGYGDTAMTTNSTLPLLLTPEECGQLLRTSRKAVYSMVERGQLPGVTRIGRRVLIHRGELLDWLDRKCSAPSPKEHRR